MNHFNETTTELFLLRISAENDDLHVIVVASRDDSRTAFRTLQAALEFITHSIRQQFHIDSDNPASAQTNQRVRNKV